MNKAPLQNSMLSSAEMNRILHERAIKLASPVVEEFEEKSENFIHFLLGDDQHYGFSFGNIKAVLCPNKISFLPTVPNYFSGLINSPYGLLPVVNLNVFLNIDNVEQEKKYAWVIVVDNGHYLLGLEVKKILMNESYSATQLEKSVSHFASEKMNYVVGIVDNRVAIISVQKIMQSIENDVEHLILSEFGGKGHE